MEVGIWAATHTWSAVNPFIEQDLEDAKTVPLKCWTEAIFGLPAGRLAEWTQKIRSSEWFTDDIIQEALFRYCTASDEKERYEPFVTLCNRIVDLARGKLPGLNKRFHLNDFTFADNHDRFVDAIAEHEGLGALRNPDIVGLLRKHAKKLQKSGGTIRWVDILLLFELKFRLNLLEPLNDARLKRGLPALSSSGVPVELMQPQDHEKTEGIIASEDVQAPSTKRRILPSRRAKVAAPRPPARRTRGTAAVSPAPITPDERGTPFGEDDLLAGLHRNPRTAALNPRNDKTDDLDAGRDVSVQTASYALELLSCTYGTRAFCLSAIIKDDVLSLWYYDACGIVYTKERLSLVAHFEKFAAIIVGFAQCSAEQFGAIPASILRPQVPYPRKFPPPNLNDNSLWITSPEGAKVGITLEDPVFSQYVMAGRRTFVYTIETDEARSDKKLIIKFSYQVSTRRSEHSLVEAARKAKVRHLPDVHMWADLWKMSDGVRRIFFDDKKIKAAQEDRTLRAIVYTRYSSVKPLFSESPELMPVMVYQIMKCLDDLWTKANMLHRDVSLFNIMFEKRIDYYHFVLIDFDMAVVLPKDESTYIASSHHRTGTLPFMSHELVFDACRSMKLLSDWTRIKHLLRHDFESLLWVCLWCVLTLLTKGLERKKIDILLNHAKELELGSLDSIASRKFYLLMNGLTQYGIVLPPAARPLKKWFRVWTRALARTCRAVSSDSDTDTDSEDSEDETSTDDWETAGGRVTRAALQPALLKAFPIPARYLTPEPEDTEPGIGVGAPRKPLRPVRKKAKICVEIVPRVPEDDNIRSRLRPRKNRS